LCEAQVSLNIFFPRHSLFGVELLLKCECIVSVVMADALREWKFQKKKAPIPFSLLLPCCDCGRGCMDVIVRVFRVTSTSLSFVFWGLFGFLYGALGSVCALSCVRFRRGFVNNGIAKLVSVLCVVNFCLETVIIPTLFECA